MPLEREILAHYDEGREQARLTAAPSLELLRTQVILRRRLPAPPARVLDVGGGAGVHAAWLADAGYRVHLVDPVPLHLEQAAAHGGFTTALGDARELAEDDGSVDVTLLLGPLYHLTDAADRLRALQEARRVTVPGGLVAAAGISRYASTFDGYFRGFLDEPGFEALVRADLATGQHRNPTAHPRFFTTAYFHRADELTAELTSAGLTDVEVLPVEGPLFWAPGIQDRLADPAQRELVLEVLATMEQDPALRAATAHLLAVGRVS
jgi:SAM-dependent methyltransferase